MALAPFALALLLPLTAAGAPSSPPADAAAPAPRRTVLWALVPFGVGQLANRQPVKGALFCAGEVAAFSTAAAALAAFESHKHDGRFLSGGGFEDVALARRLQTTYLVAAWTGVGLAALGILDALVFRPGEGAVHMGTGPSANGLAWRF